MVATTVARKQLCVYLMHEFVVPECCCAGSQRRLIQSRILNHGHKSSCPLKVLYFYNRALKSHALSVSLTHFDAISRSHAGTSISHAFALFW